MQVYLTAWMLSPMLDEQRIEAHLALMAAEMKAF
jgi:hypothetical protein